MTDALIASGPIVTVLLALMLGARALVVAGGQRMQWQTRRLNALVLALFGLFTLTLALRFLVSV